MPAGARHLSPEQRSSRWYDRREIAFAVAAGLGVSAFTWWLWGSWTPKAVASDETAYLLQARIFASGRLVADARPLPEFFWQYHVFVDPVLAAKYPPGHSALLALGYLLGGPWLTTLFLASLNAGLLYLLARRWTSRGTAVLAVALMATSGISMRFWPSYFSETTTATLSLVAWFSLARHWDTGAARWLCLLAAALALGEITRPVTMLAFAISIAIPTLASLRCHQAWRQLIPAAILGGAILSASLEWNARVTGNPLRMPFSEYARRFTPTDRIGFGAASDRPTDTVSTELTRYARLDRSMHERFTLGTLGQAIVNRVAMILRGTWQYAGLPMLLLVFARMGLPRGVFRLALGTTLLVFVAYLSYGHIAAWTVYYLEIQAPLAFLTAVGVSVVSDRASHLGVWANRDRLVVKRVLVLVGGVLLVAPSVAEARSWREAHQADRALIDAFERAIDNLPRRPAVAFVRENSDAHPERTVVSNVVDLSAASVWIVHDRGADNQKFAAIANGRTLYRLNEERDAGLVRFAISALGDPPAPAEKPSPSALKLQH